MADITLADYTGYIFLEIIKAREMADRHSRQLAEVYAQDPVLKHFSVPRFKVPKMELTIPVLISGARFNQVIRFDIPRERFVANVVGRIREVISSLRSKLDDPFVKPPPPAPATPPAKRAARGAASRASALPMAEQIANEFWTVLKSNPDPSQPGDRVRKFWTVIFERSLEEEGLIAIYKKTNPGNELYRQSMNDVLAMVTNGTVVDSTTIQSLLINPETNVVKNGSSDTSVFTIKAEMLEEGFFIRQIKDEATGQTRPVVEFE
jgi:hypothetical protein